MLGRDLAGNAFIRAVSISGGTIRLSVTDAARAMADVFGMLSDRGIEVRSASLAQPSLDDVFLRETGRSLRDAGDPAREDSGERVPA